MLFEMPSGMLENLIDRAKKASILSCLAASTSGIAMATISGLAGICVAMSLEAPSFNLSFCTLKAITYDSLKQAEQENAYVQREGCLIACYSLLQAVARLGSLITVHIGFAGTYLIVARIGLCSILAALRLSEPHLDASQCQRVYLRQLSGKLATHAKKHPFFIGPPPS